MVVDPCLEPPDGATGRQPLYRLGDAGMVLLVHQAGIGLMDELDLVIAKLVLKGGVDLQESALKADAAEQVGREGKELILPTGSRQQQGAQSSKQRADHGRPVTVVMGDQAWPDNGHPIRKGSHKQRSKIGESIVARCLSRLKSGTGGGAQQAKKSEGPTAMLWALEIRGAPGRIRTCDPRLRRPILYPTELRAHHPAWRRADDILTARPATVQHGAQ